ncbi:MAG: ribonuclease P protein component [Campylobacteraceae bacterium]|nr:ribonuclease P protein component [Campylobacteraceae bacterium]
MSYLSKEYRLNNSRDFKKIYKSGKKWHTPSFVAFFSPDSNISIAFVTSKKVGNAVLRNKSRRRLRAVMLSYENKLLSGKYIFVAKETLKDRTYKQMLNDFKFAFSRMNLLK